MGLISRTADKLPSWAQVILGVLGLVAFAYEVAHYGLWTALLRMIFSPTI